MVFSQRVEGLLQSFRIENIGEYFGQGILALLIAFMMIGLVKVAEVYGQKTETSDLAVKPFWGLQKAQPC